MWVWASRQCPIFPQSVRMELVDPTAQELSWWVVLRSQGEPPPSRQRPESQTSPRKGPQGLLIPAPTRRQAPVRVTDLKRCSSGGLVVRCRLTAIPPPGTHLATTGQGSSQLGHSHTEGPC